jgi:hypothetical protein
MRRYLLIPRRQRYTQCDRYQRLVSRDRRMILIAACVACFRNAGHLKRTSIWLGSSPTFEPRSMFYNILPPPLQRSFYKFASDFLFSSLPADSSPEPVFLFIHQSFSIWPIHRHFLFLICNATAYHQWLPTIPHCILLPAILFQV